MFQAFEHIQQGDLNMLIQHVSTKVSRSALCMVQEMFQIAQGEAWEIPAAT